MKPIGIIPQNISEAFHVKKIQTLIIYDKNSYFKTLSLLNPIYPFLTHIEINNF